MPEPEAVEVIRTFQERILALESRTAATMVRQYGPIWRELQGELTSLLAQIEGQQMSFAQVKRLERYNALVAQVNAQVTAFADAAGGLVTEAQRDAVGLSNQMVRRSVDARLPAGISTETLAAVGIEWNTLPAGAVEAFAGISGDGAPLGRLLAPLGPETALGVTEGISQGIALGRNPIRTARLIRDRVGMGLNRALRISRTETLRAYRESTRMGYESNRDVVKGWRRVAAHDGLTCFACLALDGTLYETRTPMDAHPNCRCGMVPETIGYRDIGLDVPEDSRQRELGPEWFKRQPVTVQRNMMGPKTFDAWQGGQFEIEDMAKVTVDPVWGASATQKPLKELVRV